MTRSIAIACALFAGLTVANAQNMTPITAAAKKCRTMDQCIAACEKGGGRVNLCGAWCSKQLRDAGCPIR